MLLNTIQDTGQPRKEELEKVPAGRAGTSPKAGLESKMGEVGGVGGGGSPPHGFMWLLPPQPDPFPPPRMVSGSR